jgi:hypothetical protein
LDSIFSWSLLGHKEIAQQHEHHEEHHYDNDAAEEKTRKFTRGRKWHGQFPSASKI